MMYTSRLFFGAACLLGLSATSANAALFHFDGNIANHNDVIYVNFSVATDATNVRVWTDSFDSATNFDPITALWNGTSGALIAQNDDNASIDPATQTWYDSGFSLATLLAGDYVFTVATYSNFAGGGNLADPQFSYASYTPIPLSQWCQPASHCYMGTYWSVRLDGVDSASTPGGSSEVPLPGTLGLLGLGLALLGSTQRKSAPKPR